MRDNEEYYWKDMEPLKGGDEFFIELCGLIDKHAEDNEERLLYLCALQDFHNSWMDNYGATGALWGQREALQLD